MATVWPWGDVGAGPLPPPVGHGLFLRCGGRRVVTQWSALLERLRLAAVGQDAARAQALHAVGPHRQEKAADALGRWQGHGREAITLASGVEGKAPLRRMHIDDPAGGDGHAVGVAPERVEHLLRSCHGPLGLDSPRLVIELGDASLQAVGCFQGRCVPSAHQGLPAVAEGRKDLGAKHGTRRRNGAQALRLGWHPACPLIGQGPAWDQSVPVAMGVEGLLPGVSEQEATEWAPQVVMAALEKRLAGRPQQQGEQRAFVGEDKGGEIMWPGKDAGALGHWQECGLSLFAPCCLGEGLALGAVAMATRGVGVALEATRPTLFCMSPALGGTTDQEVMPHLLVGWGHGGCGAGGRALEAQDVGDVPRWSGVLGPASGWMAAPGKRGHGLRPRRGAAGDRPATEPRGSG
jgi:hypothetical protein